MKTNGRMLTLLLLSGASVLTWGSPAFSQSGGERVAGVCFTDGRGSDQACACLNANGEFDDDRQYGKNNARLCANIDDKERDRLTGQGAAGSVAARPGPGTGVGPGPGPITNTPNTPTEPGDPDPQPGTAEGNPGNERPSNKDPSVEVGKAGEAPNGDTEGFGAGDTATESRGQSTSLGEAGGAQANAGGNGNGNGNGNGKN